MLRTAALLGHFLSKVPTFDGNAYQREGRKNGTDASYRDAFFLDNVFEGLQGSSAPTVEFALGRCMSSEGMCLQL